MANTTRNINVTRYDDEYALFGKALPYLAMLVGAGLAFLLGVVTRLGIYAQQQWSDIPAAESSRLVTWIIVVSCILLSALAYKLFRIRDGFHHYISAHAVVTTIAVHAWLIVAVWQDMGEWMFGTPTLYVYFYGGAVIGLSWCIRRWSYRGDEPQESSDSGGNPFATIGLGENTHVVPEKSYSTENGRVFRMKLALGKTVEDAKNKAVELAQLAGKPRALVHVSETEDGVEGQVDVMILNDNPFKEKIAWKGPEFPGDSIGTPITFATYDTGQRGQFFIAGKDGGSSQHFLTMGMPGTGKSKVWQAIYGTVLSRKNVSVIYGDPAKGMQTGGALASGLTWFEWTEEGCKAQIDAVMNAIPVRTNYLTSKGYSHWMPGCGLNFVIFHLEEAARFANVSDLVQLLEAARSAGISIVLSLQRATHDRISTSARYNLGGNLCFGVKNKSDAQFGLSEYARQSGAAPHMWQDRFPGYFYLESSGIDQRLAGHPLMADWIDESFLERCVDEGAYHRTPLDTTTAEALGQRYMDYRAKVDGGATEWQDMRRNKDHQSRTLEQGYIPQLDDTLPFNVEVMNPTETRTVATVKSNLGTDPDDTAKANADFMGLLNEWHNNGKHTFSHKEVTVMFTSRKGSWISKKLAALQKEGMLNKTPEGLWRIVKL
jgi:hypothetical protein